MNDLLITFLGIGGAHMLAATAQAWVLFWFADAFKARHLKTFGWSMVTLAVAMTGFLGSFYFFNEPNSGSLWVKLLVSWITQFGFLSHYALLVLAVLETVSTRTISKRAALAGSSIAGLLLVLPFSMSPGAADERLFLRVGVHYCVGSLVYVGLAIIASKRTMIDSRALRNGFALGAALRVLSLGLFSYQFITNTRFGAPLVPLFDLGGTAALCSGMMLWLLEETRRKGMRASDDLARLTHYDSATGLANGELLQIVIREGIERVPQSALLVIDLDHFRNIGDSLRRDQANQVFREVAARIKSQLPTDATLARMKHDTFSVYAPSLDARACEQLASRIQTALAPEMLIEERQLFLTGSIGMALQPTDAASGEDLLKAAMLAVNQCKSLGRGQCRFYAPELNEQANRRLALTAELRRAVNEDQFVLHYQPIVDPSGKIVCFEALLRWNHPQRGLLMPAEFVGNLLPAGISGAVDRLVLRKAAETVKRWRLQYHQDFSVAVNISAASFQDLGFASHLTKLLNELALSATALEIEITESTALENIDLAMSVLAQLRGLGVRASLDDFGTGFSSLSHLRVLPISRIKIDRSFVRDIPSDRKDGAIVAALIELAHSLDLTVIAEGVETNEQRVFLDSHGVDLLQGYLLYRPKSAEEIDDVLQRGGKRLSVVSDDVSGSRKRL
jgi:diguanylate cyclase (GGDEF)-like protein